MTIANLANEKFFLDLVAAGKLRVTRAGQIFNLTTGKEVGKEKLGHTSYRKVSWKNHETQKIVQIQLHRLVWAVYNGIPDDPELELNHKNGIKSNCKLSNLELITSGGNTKHARATGLLVDPRGELNSRAIFKDAEVVKYRRRFALGKITRLSIIKAHQCSYHAATTMLSGFGYSHLVTGYEDKCRALLGK